MSLQGAASRLPIWELKAAQNIRSSRPRARPSRRSSSRAGSGSRDEQAAAHANAAAIKRIAPRSRRRTTPSAGRRTPRRRSPGSRHPRSENRQCPLPGNDTGRAEMGVERNIEQQGMRDTAQFGDRRDQNAADICDHNRDRNEHRFRGCGRSCAGRSAAGSLPRRGVRLFLRCPRRGREPMMLSACSSSQRTTIQAFSRHPPGLRGVYPWARRRRDPRVPSRRQRRQ